MAPERSPAGRRPRWFPSATASLSSRPLTVVLSLRVPPVRPRGVHLRSRRLHPRGVALRRGQRLQGLVGRGQLHGGPPHLRGQQLPVPHGPLHPSALDVRRRRRLPGRLGRRPPILRYASTRPFTPAEEELAHQVSVLGFQRGLSATASCAPTTPAFPPPPTATASRSVQTAPTSRTAVSEGWFREDALAKT